MYATTATRSAARRLVDALEVAEGLDIEVWCARAAQGACVIQVGTRGDGERLARELDAIPARFGWTTQAPTGPAWAVEAVSVVVEHDDRPEVHPAHGPAAP